jgi:DNA-binding transcriptional LysR family regulator
MDLEHRHIEVFRAIMRSGSVTGASSLLGTSQPTISRDLARMEYLLGFALFDRIKGRLRPTARALVLYEEVQRSYLGLERVLAAANSLREAAGGQLTVVCVPAFAQALLPAACRRFHAAHAEVGISITPQESPLLEEWLSAQRHDLGLLEHDRPPPGTTLETLLQADEVCVLPVGHPLAAKAVLQPQDFTDQSFVSLSATDPYRVMLDKVFAERAIPRRLLMETLSAASVCCLVREGLGIAIVNPLTALEHADRGIVLRRFSLSIPFVLALARPQYRPSNPLADEFVLALRAQASEIQGKLQHLPQAPH